MQHRTSSRIRTRAFAGCSRSTRPIRWAGCISHLVNQLQDKYPDLLVELTLTNTFIDPVLEGADVTIRVGGLVDSGLIGKTVCSLHYVLAASPQYLQERGIPQTPEDLLQHNCCCKACGNRSDGTSGALPTKHSNPGRASRYAATIPKCSSMLHWPDAASC
jgi:DNA-binding transcriptional LysR family regulator